MSDLSQPPLTLSPRRNEAAGTLPDAVRPEPFAWPTPPFASYAAPASPVAPEPCEIEGLNGSRDRRPADRFRPRRTACCACR